MDSHGVFFGLDSLSKTNFNISLFWFLTEWLDFFLFLIVYQIHFLFLIVYQKQILIFPFFGFSRSGSTFFCFWYPIKNIFLVFCFWYPIKNIFLVFYFFISVIWIAKKLFKVLFFGLKILFYFFKSLF